MPMIISQDLFGAMREGLAWIVGRRQRVKVTGRSMVPTLSEGEFVLVDPARRPQLGQLVVATHPSRPEVLVLKRLQSFDGDHLVLASDNPDEGTDSRTWGPVSVDLLVGVVTLVLDRPTTGPDLGGQSEAETKPS